MDGRIMHGQEKPGHWSKGQRIEIAIPVKENVRQMIVISAS